MKKVLVIGSGISGLTCAIGCASMGMNVVIASPYPSERSQSVMAAGGINAVGLAEDSYEKHAEDTIKGGLDIADRQAVLEMCREAPEIIGWLESIGTVFTKDDKGRPVRRPLGGHSEARTVFAGTATGKLIVASLVRELRKYICRGNVEHRMGLNFHSVLLRDGVCCGALMYNERARKLEVFRADAVVMATGGQNALFGKTTGSMICDGYATGRLFMQGAKLKNLEFIQFHPTAVETHHKKILISEAARGEGGRLYYIKDGKRVYFMEDMFGEKGNLMPRDVVARCIYNVPEQVYLDISFLDKNKIGTKLGEVEDLCRRYAGIDVTKDSIPVSPAVHFFMGGLAVDRQHRTNLKNLYAVGECASMYHGANRLGANSLLAAIYSARVAARSINDMHGGADKIKISESYIAQQEAEIAKILGNTSRFPAVYVKQEIEKIMNEDLGISRTESKLARGVESLDYFLSISDKLNFDSDISPYQGYSLGSVMTLARAILTCAESRKESRGAHSREDYPETLDKYRCASIIAYNEGRFDVSYKKEEQICW